METRPALTATTCGIPSRTATVTQEKIELLEPVRKGQVSGQCHLDTVPCVEDDGKQYVCPRNDDDLEETDGTGFRDWFNDQNRLLKEISSAP